MNKRRRFKAKRRRAARRAYRDECTRYSSKGWGCLGFSGESMAFRLRVAFPDVAETD